MNMFFIWLHF